MNKTRRSEKDGRHLQLLLQVCVEGGLVRKVAVQVVDGNATLDLHDLLLFAGHF